ncbi:MAG: class I SAM-dependent methyltransferase [Verrucomicrobiaceae bacterium]
MSNSYYDEYWNKRPEEWTPSSGTISVDENALFSRYLHSGTRCLDYGCGDGLRYGKKLTEKGVQHLGFDISENAVRQAQGLGLDVKLLTPAGKTSLEDASVDVAICFEVLEHLQEPQNALAEISRCLKPGGHVLISVPNAAFWTQRIEFLLTGFWCPGGSPMTARKSPWCDPHIRFFYPKLLRRLALSAGLEAVESIGEAFTLGSLPYVWRRSKLRAMADFISRPVGWLGRALPSWFAARLFLVARKPG